jgi:hypothetical protein
MHALAVRSAAATPPLAQALVPAGVGRSFGLTFLVRQRPWHGFEGWVSCTLSRSERRDAADAVWRRFDDDQPLLLAVVARQSLGPWSLGARLRGASGLPRTPVVGAFYDAKDDRFDPIFGAQNSIRLPSFWQLDLRVDRSWPLGSSARAVVYVEALDVTGRANAEDYAYSADFTHRSLVTGLPFAASLGARVEL